MSKSLVVKVIAPPAFPFKKTKEVKQMTREETQKRVDELEKTAIDRILEKTPIDEFMTEEEREEYYRLQEKLERRQNR